MTYGYSRKRAYGFYWAAAPKSVSLGAIHRAQLWRLAASLSTEA
jgi:hypothetical protein